MPIFSAGQLIGKTFYVTRPLDFYRVSDINNYGDRAKPISNKLKTGYTFVMDSYLAPVQDYTNNYGVHYAQRSDSYFSFYGHDKGYYAVKYAGDGRFSLKKLMEQGAKSDVQLAAEKAEENKTAGEKLSDMFTSLGKTTKTILFIGLGVFAVGYLLPKFIKK